MKEFLPKRWQRVFLPGGVFLFSVFILGFNLGSFESFIFSDELLYIRITHDMLTQENWLTPTLEGKPAFYKPPLLYWLILLSYKVFGFSLFSARLPSVLFSSLNILLTFFFAKKLFGKGGIISASLLISSLGTLRYSRFAIMEPALAFFITLSLYLIYLAEKKIWVILGLTLLGIASLLKGPIGLVIPLLIIIVYYIFSRQVKKLFSPVFLVGLGISLIIGMFWHLLMVQKYGSEFWNFFFLREHLGKFTSPKKPIYGFLIGFLFLLLPWTFYFLAGSLNFLYRKLYQNRSFLFLSLWIAFSLGIFLLPANKGIHWSFLVLSPACLLIEGTLTRFPQDGFFKGASFLTRVGIILLGLVLALLAFIFLELKIKVFVFFSCLLLGLSGVFFKLPLSAILVALSLTGVNQVVVPLTSPAFFPKGKEKLLLEAPLYVYKLPPGFYLFIAKKKVIPIHRPQKLRKVLEQGARVIIEENALREITYPYKILLTWPKWKAYAKGEEIWKAIKARDQTFLYQKVYLIERRER